MRSLYFSLHNDLLKGLNEKTAHLYISVKFLLVYSNNDTCPPSPTEPFSNFEFFMPRTFKNEYCCLSKYQGTGFLLEKNLRRGAKDNRPLFFENKLLLFLLFFLFFKFQGANAF